MKIIVIGNDSEKDKVHLSLMFAFAKYNNKTFPLRKQHKKIVKFLYKKIKFQI